MSERPRNDAAERAVLGAILVENAAFFEVAARLRPEHFAHPFHQGIYRTMQALAKADRAMDAITVLAELVFQWGRLHPWERGWLGHPR